MIERPASCPRVDYVQGGTRWRAFWLLWMRRRRPGGIKGACCHEWMGLDMCRLFNDGMADYVTRSRAAARAGVVPPGGTRNSWANWNAAIRELGMKGAQLCAHYEALSG